MGNCENLGELAENLVGEPPERPVAVTQETKQEAVREITVLVNGRKMTAPGDIHVTITKGVVLEDGSLGIELRLHGVAGCEARIIEDTIATR